MTSHRAFPTSSNPCPASTSNAINTINTIYTVSKQRNTQRPPHYWHPVTRPRNCTDHRQVRRHEYPPRTEAVAEGLASRDWKHAWNAERATEGVAVYDKSAGVISRGGLVYMGGEALHIGCNFEIHTFETPKVTYYCSNTHIFHKP